MSGSRSGRRSVVNLHLCSFLYLGGGGSSSLGLCRRFLFRPDPRSPRLVLLGLRARKPHLLVFRDRHGAGGAGLLERLLLLLSAAAPSWAEAPLAVGERGGGERLEAPRAAAVVAVVIVVLIVLAALALLVGGLLLFCFGFWRGDKKDETRG